MNARGKVMFLTEIAGMSKKKPPLLQRLAAWFYTFFPPRN